MTDQLTDSQRKWYDLAAKHADDFAPRAAQHDAENTYPFENMDALRASGYTSMVIPADMGGGGASLLEVCIAQNRLAQGDGPTALAVNMHFGLPYVMCDLVNAGDDRPRPLLERIAAEKLMVFGAITDPQVDSMKGITGLGYTTVKATKTDGGFLVNGLKRFGTNSPGADLFASTAIYDDPDEGEVGLIFVLPPDTDGLTCLNDWDTMSMRASQSHSWTLKDVFVEEEGVFRHKPWEWDQFARGLWAWHGGSFASIYLGIAKAARDFAIDQTKGRTQRTPHIQSLRVGSRPEAVIPQRSWPSADPQ